MSYRRNNFGPTRANFLKLSLHRQLIFRKTIRNCFSKFCFKFFFDLSREILKSNLTVFGKFSHFMFLILMKSTAIIQQARNGPLKTQKFNRRAWLQCFTLKVKKTPCEKNSKDPIVPKKIKGGAFRLAPFGVKTL